MRRTTLITAALATTALGATLLPSSVAGADDAAGNGTAAVAATPAPAPTAEPPAPAETATPVPTGTPTPVVAPTGSPTPSPTTTATPQADPTPGQEPPVAVDDVAVVRWGSSVVVDVLANDWDPNEDALTVTAVGTASLGQASLVGGSVSYAPNGTQDGQDQFEYTVSDGHGGEASATVTVTVSRQAIVKLRVPAKPHALRTYRLQGRVLYDRGADPRVRLFHAGPDGWEPYRWLTVDDEGRFVGEWRPRVPRGVQWRAVAVWQGGNQVASRVKQSRVVARLDARVTKLTRADLPHTWRVGCPVGPSRLRAIHMTFWDYRGNLKRGTLIGAASAVDKYRGAFRAALKGGFQIKKMYPVDRYRGDDVRSMAAGNTSAFNCRHVTGNPYRMSQHSYGNAIDINPFENPYATASRIYPRKAAVPYYHRREKNLDDPGVMSPGTPIVKALYARNWYWGARWSHRDYQHWSSNGG